VPGLNIKSVAHLSGLSAHTLRAWEKRYQVIQPERSEGGRRLYSMADVEKLKLLGTLVSRGHAIGTIARMSTEELSALRIKGNKDTVGLTPSIAPSQPSMAPSHQAGLLTALRLLDLDELDRQILKARMDTTARVFALDVVSPLLLEVGRLVAKRTLDVAQEHALSAIMRNHLGEILSQVQKANPWAGSEPSDLPSFLFATAEGDLHEFGILLAAILTGSRGLSFRYLGPNMPAGSLAKAAAAIGAKIVVLGSVQASSDRLAYPLKEYVQLLSTHFSKSGYHDASVWIGGHCDFKPGPKLLTGGFKHLDSLVAFDRELEGILQKANV
jgi:DNA-binding transcriptional MerR regulator